MSSKVDAIYCSPAFSLQTFENGDNHRSGQTTDTTKITTFLGRAISTDMEILPLCLNIEIQKVSFHFRLKQSNRFI
jgi:hypothetical protein